MNKFEMYKYVNEEINKSKYIPEFNFHLGTKVTL